MFGHMKMVTVLAYIVIYFVLKPVDQYIVEATCATQVTPLRFEVIVADACCGLIVKDMMEAIL